MRFFIGPLLFLVAIAEFVEAFTLPIVGIWFPVVVLLIGAYVTYTGIVRHCQFDNLPNRNTAGRGVVPLLGLSVGLCVPNVPGWITDAAGEPHLAG